MLRPTILATLIVSAATANADVYKCTASDGALTFSDKPCPGQTNEPVNVRAGKSIERQREHAAGGQERDRTMGDGRSEKKVGNTKPVSKPSRSPAVQGMTKQQVRSALGTPDFESPTMWGYHDDPPTTVTFGTNGMVTSTISGP